MKFSVYLNRRVFVMLYHLDTMNIVNSKIAICIKPLLLEILNTVLKFSIYDKCLYSHLDTMNIVNSKIAICIKPLLLEILNTVLKFSIYDKCLYSQTSLSRTRLFRITAYLEVKIWPLF